MESEHQFTFVACTAAGAVSALLIVYAGIKAGVAVSTTAAYSLAIGVAIAVLSLILLFRGWDGATKAVAAVAGAWSWLWVASMLRNLAYTFRDPHSPLHGVNMSHPFWSALWFQALVFIALAGLAIYSAWNWWCDDA